MISSYIVRSKIFFLFLINVCYSQEFKGFDDTILYKINWPGKDVAEQFLKEQDENTLGVKTAIGESYQCFLPKQDEVNKESEPSYKGPNPLELLSPLFKKKLCSYRVDTYWIYEVCHGRHVRQYHNDRDGRSEQEQEFYLGKWKMFDGLKLEQELRKLASLNYPGPSKTRKVEGVNLPYFEMNMSDGTVCDLSGKPRKTNVLYVCYPQSKHNLFSVKEISTCQYEVIVLTSFLCSHPWYKPPNSDELSIDCLPVGDSPRKPHNLRVLQSDTFKIKQRMKLLTNAEPKIRFKIHSASLSEINNLPTEDSLLLSSKTPNNEIEEYLSGHLCLRGGSGWWKYEICYNKYIRQVHQEHGKPDEIVLLGEFSIQEHIKWLSNHEDKKPKLDGNRQVIHHFYSSGSECHQTGEKRETEVRYKCVKGQYNEDTIALFLIEPKTCKYILTIESPSLCEIINGPMDEYGIFNIKSNSNVKNDIHAPSSSASIIQTEDKIEVHLEEDINKENTVSVEHDTKISDDKKKTGKIEL